MSKKRRKKKNPPKMKTCHYECYECKFKWGDYRLLPVYDDDGNLIGYKKHYGPGMTLCPSCKHEYVHWINYEAFAKWYRKNIGDGGCGGEKTNG